MDISRLGIVAGRPVQAASGSAEQAAAGQFDALFYRMLLETVNWTSGIAGGTRAEQGVFGGMVTDFFAEEAARQQKGFGAMLLNTIDGQGKGTR